MRHLDEPWQRAAAARFAGALVIAAAGIVLIVAGDGTTDIVGWTVFGIALTLVLSFVFLEVGYSEDRERAREEPARRRRSPFPRRR